MVCQVDIENKQVIIGDWRIHISRSIDGGSRAPFILRERQEFSERSDRPGKLKKARSLAYRDAYAMIFMASDGESIPVCGDKTVLHNLIESGFLSFNEGEFTIEIGSKPLATSHFGLTHQRNDEKWYRAVLQMR